MLILTTISPKKKLDSTLMGKTQSQMSKLTFDKSKQYAMAEYKRVEKQVRENRPKYLFVEINKNVRRSVQSIGK